MSDLLPTQDFLNCGDDVGESVYDERSPHEVNRERIPDGRDLCLTDPLLLENVVNLQKANEVTPQQQQPGVETIDTSTVETLVYTVSNTAQALELARDLGIKTVILQAPVNQPSVDSSGSSAESLVSVPIPSADASLIGDEELDLILGEEATSTANTSVRGGKKFLWERKEPYDDPVMEKHRKAAIKQKNIRVEQKKKTVDLKRKLERTEEELTKIKKSRDDVLRENEILKELLQAALGNLPI